MHSYVGLNLSRIKWLWNTPKAYIKVFYLSRKLTNNGRSQRTHVLGRNDVTLNYMFINSEYYKIIKAIGSDTTIYIYISSIIIEA